MKSILVYAAGMSVCLGAHNEAKLVGKKFFGCSPKPRGTWFESPEPDHCVLIKFLSESEMKLQVYARTLKREKTGTDERFELKPVAETMSVFPKVSFTVIEGNIRIGNETNMEALEAGEVLVEKSFRVSNKANVDGTEYDLWTGKESRIENLLLLESLRGKIAPNHDVLMPKQIEFLSIGDGTLWFRGSTELKRIVKEPDWNVELARETKRRNPSLFFTRNNVIEDLFSPRCEAEFIAPGRYYGCLWTDVMCVEISIVSRSVMRVKVHRGKSKFEFPLVKFVFDKSSCTFTATESMPGTTVRGNASSSSISLEEMLAKAKELVPSGKEFSGKFDGGSLNVNGLDLVRMVEKPAGRRMLVEEGNYFGCTERKCLLIVILSQSEAKIEVLIGDSVFYSFPQVGFVKVGNLLDFSNRHDVKGNLFWSSPGSKEIVYEEEVFLTNNVVPVSKEFEYTVSGNGKSIRIIDQHDGFLDLKKLTGYGEIWRSVLPNEGSNGLVNQLSSRRAECDAGTHPVTEGAFFGCSSGLCIQIEIVSESEMRLEAVSNEGIFYIFSDLKYTVKALSGEIEMEGKGSAKKLGEYPEEMEVADPEDMFTAMGWESEIQLCREDLIHGPGGILLKRVDKAVVWKDEIEGLTNGDIEFLKSRR